VRLDQFAQDVHDGVRALRRTPGFTLCAIVTLALGVGANAAIFSALDAVLLRPLPFAEPAQLVRILSDAASDRPAGGPPRTGISVAELVDMQTTAQTLSHIGMFVATGGTMTARDRAHRVNGARLSANMFAMLGVPPRLGRVLEPRDAVPGNDNVLVLSHALWQRDFGADPNVVGQTVLLDTRTYSVVGVMPAVFRFPDAFADFWVPYVLPTGRGAVLQRTSPYARLRMGSNIDAAHAEVTGILSRLRQDSGAAGSQIRIVRLHDQIVEPVRAALWAIAVAVGLVLFVGCINLTNLWLARAAGRRRELAVRHALGAQRSRLIRQLLTESALLSLAGGTGAILLAYGGTALLKARGLGLPRRDLGTGIAVPRLDEITVDTHTFLFALALSVLAGLLVSVWPAIRQSRIDVFETLRQNNSSLPSGFDLFRRHRLQGGLIVLQIATSFILLVGAGLMIRTVINLLSVDPGYRAENVLTFRVSTAGGRATADRMLKLAEQLTSRIRQLPHVRAVTYAEHLPMVQLRSGVPLRSTPEPFDPLKPSGAAVQFADTHFVNRDFFSVMNMRIVEGTGFGSGGSEGKELLVNRALARTALFGGSAIGKQVYVLGPTPWHVVGIVDDVRQYGLDQEPAPQLFLEITTMPPGVAAVEYFALRADDTAATLVPSLREMVSELDPVATVESVAMLEDLVANSVVRPRLYAMLLGLFAAIALALAAVGIYGVVAYATAQRIREIGIRMALGANRRSVIGLFLRQSVVLIVIGIAGGMAGAAALTRGLERLLFNLMPLDPLTFVSAAALFALVAVAAALIPARRAANLDPLAALRCE
jgi:predicted permease